MTASSFITVRMRDERVFCGIVDPASTPLVLHLRNGPYLTRRILVGDVLTITTHRSP